MIYKAQTTLKIAKEAVPGAVTILGGIHPAYMYEDYRSRRNRLGKLSESIIDSLIKRVLIDCACAR